MPVTDQNEPRRFRRLSPKGGTWLEAFRDPDGSGPDIAVAVRDVSATGARLVFAERLPPGHSMLVTLNGQSGPLYTGVAVVAWSEQAEDGSFMTGVVFQKPVGRADLAALAR
ncbi:MAG: PilZ domain-containing protein [Gemmataceae bacterium]